MVSAVRLIVPVLSSAPPEDGENGATRVNPEKPVFRVSVPLPVLTGLLTVRSRTLVNVKSPFAPPVVAEKPSRNVIRLLCARLTAPPALPVSVVAAINPVVWLIGPDEVSVTKPPVTSPSKVSVEPPPPVVVRVRSPAELADDTVNGPLFVKLNSPEPAFKASNVTTLFGPSSVAPPTDVTDKKSAVIAAP